MTDEQLAEIQSLLENTTPGPWAVSYLRHVISIEPEIVEEGLQAVADCDSPADAEFIAAACTALPALLAEVRRLVAVAKSAAARAEADRVTLRAQRDRWKNEAYAATARAEAAEAERDELRADALACVPWMRQGGPQRVLDDLAITMERRWGMPQGEVQP